MKSLFSRFKQQQAPDAHTHPPAVGKRASLHFDEKDKRVQNLKSFFEGNASATASAPNNTIKEADKHKSDTTVRPGWKLGSRPPIPPAQRAAAVPDVPAEARPVGIPSVRATPDNATSAAVSTTAVSLPAAISPTGGGVDRERPRSRASVGPRKSSASSASAVSAASGVSASATARSQRISITSGTSGSSGPSTSRVPGHARTPSVPTTATSLRPASLLLADIDEWVVRAPLHRMSFDNVKKVAFQSPASFISDNASDPDLRSTTRSSSALGTGPREPSRRRASSPSKPRNVTPTHIHSGVHALSHASQLQATTSSQPYTRVLSRSSSHQSIHGGNKPGVSGAGGLADLQSPTKSSTSVVAPSESSAMSAASYLPIAESWSAAMDDELIANLGPRERVRQEVLWEIVNSEERYVHDLVRLNDTFCRQLLPARDNEPTFSLPDPLALTRVTSPVSSSGNTDDAHLPIAAQYSRFSTDSHRDGSSHLSSPDLPQGPEGEAARQNAYNILTRSTNSTNISTAGGSGTGSTQGSAVGTGTSEREKDNKEKDKVSNRMSIAGRSTGSRKRLSFHRSNSNTSNSAHSRIASRSSLGSVFGHGGPVTLPDDLEQVLTVISSGVLEGHIKLVTALRKRYDEQFPLVRNLADVFTAHSEILREYATYILHLERALAQVDEALAMADQIATGGRRSSRRLEETQLGKLSKLLAGLEELAAERGEAGLSISLSKPFQRLLKYPLLFQNLLYNTSPSTREYEATLAMVDEVQKIVRTIEDEKTSSEERERSRDAWARIEGMEKNKQLMAPKPNRLLVSETSLSVLRGTAPPKERKGHHRLSDILKPKHHDQWIVKFSDVSLLCEHTGTTTLPMSTKSGTLRSESLTDLSTKRMSAMGRRHGAAKSRNLYKFVKVYEWHELKPPPPRLTVEKPARRMLPDLAEAAPRTPEKIVPLKTGDEPPSKLTPRRRTISAAGTCDDGMSDKVSVMSFAFRGEARPNPMALTARSRVLPLPPAPATRVTKPVGSGLHERRGSAGHPTAAQAKFGHRLRASDDVTIRPASRVRRSLPPAMAMGALSPTNVNAANGRASPIRPPWNSSMRPASARDFSRPISSRAIRPKTSAGAVKDTTAVGSVTTTAVPLTVPTVTAANSTSTVATAEEGIWEERPGLSAATAARIARRNLGGHI